MLVFSGARESAFWEPSIYEQLFERDRGVLSYRGPIIAIEIYVAGEQCVESEIDSIAVVWYASRNI